jgi:adenylosuccinate synthase
MSNNTLILGLQWGDEGKGKIVDALAEGSEAVCRFQGGHNAGHTLKVDGEQKVLHLVPSGILHPSVHCVLGNGLVLSLPALAKEIKELQESDINFKDRFYVSEDCSLILPTHIAIDQVRDKEEGIGTTGRGIGPAYEDKIARRAVRFGDLKNLEELKIKLSTLVNYHNQILQNLYNAQPIAFEMF